VAQRPNKIQRPNKKKPLAMIEELAGIVKVAPFITMRRQAGRLFAGLDGQGDVFISDEHMARWSAAVDELWQADPDLRATLPRSKVEDAVVDLVRVAHESGRVLQVTDIDQALASLLALPVHDWEIMRPLYGAVIMKPRYRPWLRFPWRTPATHGRLVTPKQRRRLGVRLRRTIHNVRPLQFGPFTIYDPVLHVPLIVAAYPNCTPADVEQKLGRFVDLGAIISVRVSARQPVRARELADAHFQRFESVLRYMLAQADPLHDVSIFGSDPSTILDYLAIAPAYPRPLMGTHVVGRRELVDLSDPFFVRSDWGYDRVWRLVDDEYRGPIQGKDPLATRLLSAITWIGKGVADRDPARRFVQFMFALEALFTSGNKDVPITDRLAEYAAFVLEDTRSARLRVAKEVAGLYGKRSGIAHGRKHVVSNDDVVAGLHLVKKLTGAMLTKPPLASMTEMEQLEKWIKDQRYGGGQWVKRKSARRP